MLKTINKIMAVTVIFCLVFEQSGFAQMAAQMPMPQYLHGLLPQDHFRPMHLRSLTYDPHQDSFELLLDKGDGKRPADRQIKKTTAKLLEYFRIGLAVPNDRFWVNLRPDAEDNIIDPLLEKTDVGKIMLEADLQLKKDLARFTSPDTEQGRQYWNKLYARAEQLYGQQDIEIPTLTRPWIVPGEIIIRQSNGSAYVYKATLKVMLEQDYIKDSPFFTFNDPKLKELNEYSSSLIRKLILPKLTREVNASKRYAAVRQVYYSLVLAQWFKENYGAQTADTQGGAQAGPLQDAINSADLTGLESQKRWSKEKYFNAYKKSFSQGEYKKEETVRSSAGLSVRTYFSGGFTLTGAAQSAIALVTPASGGTTPAALPIGPNEISTKVDRNSIEIIAGKMDGGSGTELRLPDGRKIDGDTLARAAMPVIALAVTFSAVCLGAMGYFFVTDILPLLPGFMASTAPMWGSAGAVGAVAGALTAHEEDSGEKWFVRSLYATLAGVLTLFGVVFTSVVPISIAGPALPVLLVSVASFYLSTFLGRAAISRIKATSDANAQRKQVQKKFDAEVKVWLKQYRDAVQRQRVNGRITVEQADGIVQSIERVAEYYSRFPPTPAIDLAQLKVRDSEGTVVPGLVLQAIQTMLDQIEEKAFDIQNLDLNTAMGIASWTVDQEVMNEYYSRQDGGSAVEKELQARLLAEKQASGSNILSVREIDITRDGGKNQDEEKEYWGKVYDEILLEEERKIANRPGSGYSPFGRSYFPDGLAPEDQVEAEAAAINRLRALQRRGSFVEVVNGEIRDIDIGRDGGSEQEVAAARENTPDALLQQIKNTEQKISAVNAQTDRARLLGAASIVTLAAGVAVGAFVALMIGNPLLGIGIAAAALITAGTMRAVASSQHSALQNESWRLNTRRDILMKEVMDQIDFRKTFRQYYEESKKEKADEEFGEELEKPLSKAYRADLSGVVYSLSERFPMGLNTSVQSEGFLAKLKAMFPDKLMGDLSFQDLRDVTGIAPDQKIDLAYSTKEFELAERAISQTKQTKASWEKVRLAAALVSPVIVVAALVTPIYLLLAVPLAMVLFANWKVQESVSKLKSLEAERVQARTWMQRAMINMNPRLREKEARIRERLGRTIGDIIENWPDKGDFADAETLIQEATPEQIKRYVDVVIDASQQMFEGRIDENFLNKIKDNAGQGKRLNDLSYLDVETVIAEIGADPSRARLMREIRYITSQVAKAKRWLEENQPNLPAGQEITREKLKNFYNQVILPLVKILAGEGGETTWNQATWKAFQAYTEDKTQSAANLADKIPGANKTTLELLIQALAMVNAMADRIMANLLPEELEGYNQLVHNNGYFLAERARTRAADDQLLPVHADGALLNDGYLPSGDQQIDLLTADARARYDGRHKQPGKNSLVKLSLADFKLESERDLLNVLEFFQLNGKDVEIKNKNLKVSLRDFLTQKIVASDKKALGDVNVFNGFVQEYQALLAEAEKFAKESEDPAAYLMAQLNFLRGKQRDAVAAALLLVNLPALFKMSLGSQDRAEFEEAMDRATNVLWRVTNSYNDWSAPLIQNIYDNIGADQISKDRRIWKAVLDGFMTVLNRLKPERKDRIKAVFEAEIKMIEILTVNWSEAKKNKALAGVEKFFVLDNGQILNTLETVEECLERMTKEGYIFIGAVTASGLGINLDDREAAKRHLESIIEGWGIDWDKVVFVSGATGNLELDNKSGVDVFYELAEKHGAQKMGIMSEKKFGYPIRDVNYLLVKLGDESDRLFYSISRMLAFTGDKQAASELGGFIEIVKNRLGLSVSKNQILKGVVGLITGIRSYLPNPNNPPEAPTRGSVDPMGEIVQEFGGTVRNHVPEKTRQADGGEEDNYWADVYRSILREEEDRIWQDTDNGYQGIGHRSYLDGLTPEDQLRAEAAARNRMYEEYGRGYPVEVVNGQIEYVDMGKDGGEGVENVPSDAAKLASVQEWADNLTLASDDVSVLQGMIRSLSAGSDGFTTHRERFWTRIMEQGKSIIDGRVLTVAYDRDQSVITAMNFRGSDFNARLKVNAKTISVKMQPVTDIKGVPAEVLSLEITQVTEDAGTPVEGLGGIDFRALPIVTQGSNAAMPVIDLKALQLLASRSKIRDLDEEWKAIKLSMQKGPMPYERLKEYFAVCCQRGDTAGHINEMFALLINIMKLEEECAVPAAPELKEILVLLEAKSAA